MWFGLFRAKRGGFRFVRFAPLKVEVFGCLGLGRTFARVSALSPLRSGIPFRVDSRFLGFFAQATPQSSKPVHSAKNGADASGQAEVHYPNAALIVNERQVDLGRGNRRSPVMLSRLIDGKGAHFPTAEKTHAGREKNSASAQKNEQKRAPAAQPGGNRSHAVSIRAFAAKENPNSANR